MRNLRKFNTEAEYSAATLNYPSVAWIVSGDTFHYDKEEPQPEPAYGGLTVKYYIADPSVEVTLFNGGGTSSSSSESGSGGGALPTAMIVDGVEETPVNTWRFETSGEHIVQYAFENNEIPAMFLYGIWYLTEIEIGDDITAIPDGTSDGSVFSYVHNLTSVTIGSGVTYIGDGAFEYNVSLEGITVNATYPPQLGRNPFANTNDCPIYVPASAVDTYKGSTSTGWSEYASRIEAIQ